ncbi:MAG: PHP domain-containing protein [Kiritimatiellae bacterium]|nr:PHP domain-containing protein [Kiritimatiellia bacterium]
MIDLHVHSTFSDGSFTPEELVDKAIASGLSAMALTDHDSTSGVERLLAAGRAKGLTVISGVEISADYSPGTMHMLGYHVDQNNRDLNEHLKWIREGREARNREILHKLMELGCHITWDEVASYAGEDVVGRPHFAQALIARGYVQDNNEAFKKYLAKGAPAYADRRRLSPEDSITLVRVAGGVPVLAHPFTLRLGKMELRRELKALSECGLEGIEAYYPEHDAETTREYIKLAKDYGLIVTGGTDFHGVQTPDITLGRGFGSMKIPDSIMADLEDRRASMKPSPGIGPRKF